MSTEPTLSRSEYVVLGLVARYGAMSPYELKARVAESIGFFWPIPHAQLYRDPSRLADLGLLEETAEATGRRRRIFAITATGRAELARWLADEHTSETQIRDPALLKLAFADLAADDDLGSLAAGQAAVHHRWLEEYGQRIEALSPADPGTPSRRHLLALGRAIEAAYTDFWGRLAETERPTPPPASTSQRPHRRRQERGARLLLGADGAAEQPPDPRDPFGDEWEVPPTTAGWVP